MYVPENLKLNRFKEVSIPRNAELFARFGLTTPKGASFSGDEMASVGSSKIDTLASGETLNNAKLAEEASQQSS